MTSRGVIPPPRRAARRSPQPNRTRSAVRRSPASRQERPGSSRADHPGRAVQAFAATDDLQPCGGHKPVSSSRAPRSVDGWRSLDMARTSIWRIRSRVRLKCSPTWSRVRGSPRSSPKRSRRISRSRSSRAMSILLTSPHSRAAAAASNGETAERSSTTSPSSASPSSRKRLGERQGLSRVSEDHGDLLLPHLQVGSQLGDGRAPAQLPFETAPGLGHLGEQLTGLNREPHGAAAVGDPAADGLADPPGGVGGELEPLAPVELLDGVHQAQVAFLDQVQEGQPGGLVLLSDGHHQAQVGLDERLGRLVAVADQATQLALAGRGHPFGSGQLDPGLAGRPRRPGPNGPRRPW